MPRSDGIAVLPFDVGGDAPSGRTPGDARDEDPAMGWPAADRMAGDSEEASGRPRDSVSPFKGGSRSSAKQ